MYDDECTAVPIFGSRFHKCTHAKEIDNEVDGMVGYELAS